jgi:6-phosphogluconolactonase
MKLHLLADPETVAKAAAKIIASETAAAVASRGRFVMAISGGHTPWHMLRALSAEPLPWNKVHVFQVDERVAPAGDPDRNFAHLQSSLLEHSPLHPKHLHAMPVQEGDLEAAAASYELLLQKTAGAPPLLDLVHLGLGPDGHTASLVPGDPVLGVFNLDVALTGTYQNRRRMTLTYPILNRARRILWLVTGPDKRQMLARLQSGDVSIPAGRVRQDRALVLADCAAGNAVDTTEGLCK